MYVCWKCRKEREGKPHKHNCPYAREINDDPDYECDCCDECTDNCRDDI